MKPQKYHIETILENIYGTLEYKIEEEETLDSEYLTLEEIEDLISESLKGFKNTLCLDCCVETIPTEYYMVTNDLWSKAVPEYEGMLCIGCLEMRIGRKLNKNDFTKVPVNHIDDPTQSKRLKDRKIRTVDDDD